MHLIRHLPAAADCATAVAIGNFDGLHRGHVAVLEAMKQAASGGALVPSVLTFSPHPRRFFAPGGPPFALMRLHDKLASFRAHGVARVYMPRFNAAFAAIRAEDFLDGVLKTRLGARVVVTGEDFAFGHKRTGGSAMLTDWGKKHNIEIIMMPPVRVNATVCSSSAIRAAIRAGDVAQAAQLLGQPYHVTGRVVHGQGRGRTIGYPTANLALSPDLMLPARGVYAVRARLGDTQVDGVANIGIRPTVSVDNALSVEVYLFDSVLDIYGKKLTVSLVDKIRDEQKFADVSALTAQIARDVTAARRILATATPHATERA